MPPTVPQHPSQQQLAAFIQGRLSAAEQAALEPHISQCATCCDYLATVPEGSVIEHLAGSELHEHPAPHAPPDGIPDALRDHPRYRIVRRVGYGGMGVVYEAEHRLMQRRVALKVIHSHLLNHPTAVERFRREVQTAARLTHPNIVTAFDAERAGNLHFLAMEYVDGSSLAELVAQRGPLDSSQAVRFVCQVAIGMQHAYEQGMVHRDIKPQNLMLGSDDRVKILDFGLARLGREFEYEEKAPASPRGSGLTRADSTLGTPEFMAPEQRQSARDVDIRADIYSLGCTLHFLLVGHPPPRTKDGEAELSAGIPASLRPVLTRMLATAPSQRHHTPAAVAAALERALRPARRKILGLALGFAGILGCFWAGKMLWEGDWKKPMRGPEGTPRNPSWSPRIRPGSGPRVLLVIPPQYDARDLLAVGEHFGGRFTVYKASVSSEMCYPRSGGRGFGAFKTEVDLSQFAVDMASFDAVVFVGGDLQQYGTEKSPLGSTIRCLIADARTRGKTVCAVGQGIRILAGTSALNEINLALFEPSAKADYPQHQTWTDQPIVEDGRIVTARDATAVGELAARLLRNGAADER